MDSCIVDSLERLVCLDNEKQARVINAWGSRN